MEKNVRMISFATPGIRRVQYPHIRHMQQLCQAQDPEDSPETEGLRILAGTVEETHQICLNEG